MIIYQSIKQDFLEDVISGEIEDIIYREFKSKLGHSTSKSEISSWQQSMQYMQGLLSTPDIPHDCGIAIEYKIPQTSKRIDFILSGLDQDEKESAIVIELKQWSEAQLTDKDGIVKTRFGKNLVEVSHPSYQAWTYGCLLRDYNEYIYSNAIRLQTCAYLHNYKLDDVITHSHYDRYLNKAPVFLRNDAFRLREFISKYIKKGDQGKVLYKIEEGRIRPSKQLAESVSSMLDGNEEFLMIDEQKLVYETALSLQRRLGKNENEPDYSLAAEPVEEYGSNKKYVFIVEGGPGTGKSVVAINLLVEFTRNRLLAQYISKNAAPRAVYESKLTGKMRPTKFKNMFKGSGAYVNAEENTFDVLIVDEAHRLNEKSGLYGNQGDHQVKEIINASRLSIFFIDDDQRVHIKDVGKKDDIKKIANQIGAEVFESELSSQFRCDGSDGYLQWLDHQLQIRNTAAGETNPSEFGFDFKVFDSPDELRSEIEKKNKINNKARLVAGYCWDWVSKKDPALVDIALEGYDFSMKWNLTSDGSLWIVAEDSINEVGCIHTCQGLEVDYIGVLLGPDLIIRNGEVVTNPDARAKTDYSIRGWKTMMKKDPNTTRDLTDRIIKNTYRTLMTRGMKGCYIWSADEETRDWFR